MDSRQGCTADDHVSRIAGIAFGIKVPILTYKLRTIVIV